MLTIINNILYFKSSLTHYNFINQFNYIIKYDT